MKDILVCVILIIVGIVGVRKTKFPNFKDYSVICVKFPLFIGYYIILFLGIYGMILKVFDFFDK